MTHDLVLAGGRVLDPETGVDRVCNAGIDGGPIAAVGDTLDGATTVDVRGWSSTSFATPYVVAELAERMRDGSAAAALSEVRRTAEASQSGPYPSLP